MEPERPGVGADRVLYQLYRQLDSRIGDLERGTREQVEALRAELMPAIGELRGAHAAVTAQIRDSEDPERPV